MALSLRPTDTDEDSEPGAKSGVEPGAKPGSEFVRCRNSFERQNASAPFRTLELIMQRQS